MFTELKAGHSSNQSHFSDMGCCYRRLFSLVQVCFQRLFLAALCALFIYFVFLKENNIALFFSPLPPLPK